MNSDISSSYIKINTSYELQCLLRKKLFSRSKYFYSNVNPAFNSENAIPVDSLQKLSIVKNYLICSLLLIVYFISMFKFKSKDRGKSFVLIYSLTKEQAIRNGSIKSLSAFLDAKGILRNCDSIVLIEIRKIVRSKKYKTLRTTLDIPLSIFSNSLSIRTRMTCWFSMCQRFYNTIRFQDKNKQVVLTLKEYVFDEVVYSALNANFIEKLITTQNHLAYQPLIFEFKNQVGKRIMVWYSSNSIPIKYKGVKHKRFQLNPAVYKTMCIDEHWVWTRQHKNYLTKHIQAKVLVKKSMMFYQAELSKNSNKVYDVTIFDVTPSTSEVIYANSIYTTNEMIGFVTEIIESVKKLNIKHGTNFRVYLKHKRKISKSHSLSYSKFISAQLKSNDIRLVHHNQNLYDLIQQSKLVIGFPFTSPVVIGHEINVPAIYYCSSELLGFTYKTEQPVLLQSKNALFAHLEKKLVVVK